jgi:hypothetical protein
MNEFDPGSRKGEGIASIREFLTDPRLILDTNDLPVFLTTRGRISHILDCEVRFVDEPIPMPLTPGPIKIEALTPALLDSISGRSDQFVELDLEEFDTDYSDTYVLQGSSLQELAQKAADR